MRVFSVIGTSGSGKSSFCDRLTVERGVKLGIRPILLKMGSFFKNTFGESFFYNDLNSVTSELVDDWVLSMVKKSLALAVKLDRDLVIDAFPRNLAQLSFFYDLLQRYKIENWLIYHTCIELELVQMRRLKQRSITNNGLWFDREISFYHKKIEIEAKYISEILISIGHYQKNKGSLSIDYEVINNG